MNNIFIRKAQLNDAVSLALLSRITFRDAFGNLFTDNQNLLNYFDTSFSVEAIKKMLHDENNVFWLALSNDLPVGYAKLIKQSPSKLIADTKVSELQRIYVLKDFLNMKIGHQLQEAVFNEVRLIKSKHLWLYVYVDNTEAIKFYKRYNFDHIGYDKFGIRDQYFDFSVMNKIFN